MGYYLILGFSVLLTSLAGPKTILNNKCIANTLTMLLVVLGSVAIVVDGVSGDMIRYMRTWEYARNSTLVGFFGSHGFEPGFLLFQWITSRLFSSPYMWQIVVALCIWWLIYLASKRIFYKEHLAYVFFCSINLFYFWSFSTNVVRQGLAVGIILLSVAFFLNHKPKIATLLILLAFLFHNSAIIGLVLLPLYKFDLSVRNLLWVWVISVVAFLLGVNNVVASFLFRLVNLSLRKDYLSVYTSSSITLRYLGGVNRIDFLLFSAFWIVWGVVAKKYFVQNDRAFDWLFKCYIAFNSIFLLLGFMAYSDRIAGYSWMLTPFLLAYPCLNSKSRYRKLYIFMGLGLSVVLAIVFNVHTRFLPITIF